MLKKIAAIATAGAMIFSISGFAFASNEQDHHDNNGGSVTISNEDLRTTVSSFAGSMTGGNLQFAPALGASQDDHNRDHEDHNNNSGSVSQDMSTGEAWAQSSAYANVGSTFLPGCACSGSARISVSNEDFFTRVNSWAFSSTGDNVQTVGSMHGHDNQSGSGEVTQEILTGKAGSSSDASAFVAYTDFSVSQSAN